MIVSEGGVGGREPRAWVGRDPKLHPPAPLLMHEPSRGGGRTTDTIGYMKGGTPRKFEFKREGG
ncbi:MAG: hypothetical protein WAO58_04120 [Fimbriimonadaceae bacterium]